jgi:hypothetical protein
MCPSDALSLHESPADANRLKGRRAGRQEGRKARQEGRRAGRQEGRKGSRGGQEEKPASVGRHDGPATEHVERRTENDERRTKNGERRTATQNNWCRRA